MNYYQVNQFKANSNKHLFSKLMSYNETLKKEKKIANKQQ